VVLHFYAENLNLLERLVLLELDHHQRHHPEPVERRSNMRQTLRHTMMLGAVENTVIPLITLRCNPSSLRSIRRSLVPISKSICECESEGQGRHAFQQSYVQKVRSRLKKAHTIFEIRSERVDRGQSSSESKLRTE
jgi:hypothetical protein